MSGHQLWKKLKDSNHGSKSSIHRHAQRALAEKEHDRVEDLGLESLPINVDQRAAGGRVLSLLWLRRERLDVSLLYLSWLPHAAGPALNAEFFCFLHPDPCFSLCLSSCV